jgi:hypothetical protein
MINNYKDEARGAYLLGVPRVTLREWIDSGHVPRPQTVERIKEFLWLRI